MLADCGGANTAHLKQKKLNRVKRNILSVITTSSHGEQLYEINQTVKVAHLIANGKNLSQLKFHDELEIHIDEGESIVLPFRYLVEEGKVIVAKGVVDLAKKEGF